MDGGQLARREARPCSRPRGSVPLKSQRLLPQRVLAMPSIEWICSSNQAEPGMALLYSGSVPTVPTWATQLITLAFCKVDA